MINDSRLFLERFGFVTFEFEVADDASGRRVFFSEPVGADVVFEVVDAEGDIVSEF